jgi:DNA-binding XRE family transcriptional regulator
MEVSHSTFRKLRQAADLTQASIAKALDVPLGAKVKRWDRGGRPRWRHMPDLARFFKRDLAEAVRLFWNETVEDLCECGCGGRKDFPDYDGAQHLSVKLPCEGCGEREIRTYRKMDGHAKLCRDCSFAARGKAPPRPSFPVTCVGYQLPGMTVPHFACPEPHQTRIRPSRLKNYPGSKILRSGRTSDDGVHTFVNEAEGKYRCNRCAGVMELFRAREKRAKDFWSKAKPADNVPMIRNATQLKDLEKECFTLSYKDKSGTVVKFNPDLEKGRRKKKKTWPLRGKPVQRKHRLKMYRRWQGTNATVKGLCLIPGCGKLVLSPGKTPRYVHMKYFNEW